MSELIDSCMFVGADPVEQNKSLIAGGAESRAETAPQNPRHNSIFDFGLSKNLHPNATIIVVDHFDDSMHGSRYAHGTLVEAHIRAALDQNLEPADFFSAGGWLHAETIELRRGITIDRVKVESGYQTKLIGEEVAKCIQKHRDNGIDTIVVNMSWFVASCSDAEVDFNDRARLNQTEPVTATQRIIATGKMVANEYSPKYITVTERTIALEDGLQENLQLYSPAIFVASAGNDVPSSSDPLYPAQLEQVIAVSSYNVDTGVKSSFSNSGQVMAPGATFGIEMPDSKAYELYQGTSFAAATLSAYLALNPKVAKSYLAVGKDGKTKDVHFLAKGWLA